MVKLGMMGLVLAAGAPLAAQQTSPAGTTPATVPAVPAVGAPSSMNAAAMPAKTGRMLPASTMMVVTPLAEVSSKTTEVGQQAQFAVVNDVIENGVVAIPRGTPVMGQVSWKTGRAIGGKSGKFDIEFKTITLGGRSYALRGTHRQEGRGNTVGALFGSILISGRSAVMTPGQMINVFTAEQIAY